MGDRERLITAYESMFSTTGEAIAFFDTSGDIFRCNEPFLKLFSCNADEIKEHTVFSLLGPALKGDIASALGGEAIRKEAKIATTNGEPVYAAVHLGPLKDSGELCGGYAVLDNITACRQREDALAEWKLRLHSLINKASLGIVVIDQQHKIIETNERFAEMLGYPVGEMLTLHTWDWEAVMTREEIEEQFKDLSKINMTFETKHRRKDGTLYDACVSATGTCIEGQGGRYNAVICICEDITAQKETERKLIRSEKKFRSFVENAADVVFILDEAGNAVYVSPNCMNMWGAGREEMEGLHFTELLGLTDREYHMGRYGEYLREGAVPYAEFNIKGRDGTCRWFGINGSVSADEDGGSIVICNARNIDEMKGYEEKLKYLSTHDQLTGIYNRVFFYEELERQYAEGMYPLSIVFCDIDGLKKVNDTLGHDVGDEMIRDSAMRLMETLRDGDYPARIGGDEFAIIMPLTGEDEAHGLIDGIREQFGDTRGGKRISIGFTTVHDSGKSITQALREADTDMYADKRMRRGRG